MNTNPFFRANATIYGRHATHASDTRLRELWTDAIRERYKGQTVLAYTAAADRFFEFLEATETRLADLAPQVLSDYLQSLALRCRHLNFISGGIRCRAGVFPLSSAPPPACGFECASYEPIKVVSYQATEKALARLFEFAGGETDYPTPAFFTEVQARIHAEHRKRSLREREDARYPRRALDDEELERLFAHSRHPRDRFTLALMIKTGLRSQEALSLIDNADERRIWDEERLITVLPGPGVKRLGNSVVVIDDQLWSVLDEYLEWKDGQYLRHPKLLVGKEGRRPLGIDGMAALWAGAGKRAEIKIHPLKDKPLTAHSARHTFCRLLEQAGFNSFWVARFRGDVQGPDAATRSAWTYAKRSPNEIRDAYLGRFPRLPIDTH